jgi:glycosyltransferase involved in cell wall biosynthesis
MISIIIPIKTTENEYWDLLPKAIKSVLRQTNKDYELIISQYDNDVSEGRNKGIERAHGEYCLTLDADDTLHPQFLEKVKNYCGQYDIVATDGYISGFIFKKKFIAKDGVLEDFLQNNRILNCSIFKKEIWNRYHFNENLGGYEDWDFWVKALRNGYKIGVIHEPLVNISNRFNSRNKGAIRRHNELKDEILKL